MAPDVEKTAFGKLAKNKLMGGVTKKIMHRWSVCQTLPFSEQLRAGVRYFDLRLGYRGKADAKLDSEEQYHDAIYFVHGLFGLKLRTGLAEILRFLDEHPREVVLLHFQHFYNFKEDIHAHCKNLLVKTFSQKLCPSKAHASELTVKQMWENNWQVVLIYQHPSVSHEAQTLMWNGHSKIVSPWGNVSAPGSLVEFLRKAKNRHDKKFYVSQAVLTPDTSMIVKHCASSLKDCCAKKATRDVNRWLQSLTPGEHGLNIFIVDFVEMGDFIQNVLRLNKQ